jgi:hypothetical protein
VFRLSGTDRFVRAKSTNWEIVEDRKPTADDVYVVLEKFMPKGYEDSRYHGFFGLYEEMSKLHTGLSLRMPEIYGYRTSEKMPVDEAGLIGREFNTWRTQIVDTLFDENRDNFIIIELARKVEKPNEFQTRIVRRLYKELHPEHTVLTVLEIILRAHKRVEELKRKEPLDKLFTWRSRSKFPDTNYDPDLIMAPLTKSYPLMFLYGDGFKELWGKHAIKWFKYVKLLDENLQREATK